MKDSRRILGTENEALGDDSMIPKTKDPYFVRMLTLKSLQLRMNWLNVNERS